MKKRTINENIIHYLENYTSSRIIYTIFVYSGNNKYFTQSNLQNILYDVEQSKNINNTITRYIKLMDGLFFDVKNKSKKRKVSFYPYNGLDNGKLLFGFQKTTKGLPIVPSFKWLELLYGIKVTDSQANQLLLFFQKLKFQDSINCEDFPGHKDTNILELFKKAYEVSFFRDKIGEVLFKENLDKAREEYNETNNRITKMGNTAETKDLPKEWISLICKKYDIKLDKYNKIIISVVLSGSNSIFNSKEFKHFYVLLWKDYRNAPYSQTPFFTVKDILIFMGKLAEEDNNYEQKED